MRPLYIFDLDGTLADAEHRLHYIQGKAKDWAAFFAASKHDAPIKRTIDLLKRLRKGGAEVWIWTGRSDEVRAETEQWLHDNGVLRWPPLLTWSPLRCPWSLLMRKAGDHRPDHVVKQEWLSELEPPEWKRLTLYGGVFEDRARVVEMWRGQGVQCYQVAPGDF